MLRKASAQGAYVGYVHPYAGEHDPLDGGSRRRRRARSSTPHSARRTRSSGPLPGRAGFFPLYALWNNGLKVTAVGGEDSISNLHSSKLVGSAAHVCLHRRTRPRHARVARRHARRTRVCHQRAARRVDGQWRVAWRNGERCRRGGGTVGVQARVRSIVPLQKVTLYFNGQAVEDIPLGADRRSADFSKTLPGCRERVVSPARGRCRLPIGFHSTPRYPQGFTNPVWVDRGQPPVRDRASAEYALRWIDKLQKLAEAWPGMALAEGKRSRVRAVRRGASSVPAPCCRGGEIRK